jgi:hypothetical protein
MYESPSIEVVASASTMIQAYAGPYSDGGGYLFSWGFVCGPEEQ